MKNLQQLEIHVKAIQEILLAQDPERYDETFFMASINYTKQSYCIHRQNSLGMVIEEMFTDLIVITVLG